jgi:hypothetical protein
MAQASYHRSMSGSAAPATARTKFPHEKLRAFLSRENKIALAMLEQEQSSLEQRGDHVTQSLVLENAYLLLKCKS